MMVYGIPKCTHTCLKKSLVVASAVILFLQAIRMAILENRSMTTKTKSLPCLVEGRPDMYYIEMDSQGLSGIGRGVYIPCFLVASLAMAHVVQDLIYLLTSCRSFDQYKCFCSTATVFCTPKCPAI
jgi:hypothetical protein